MKTAFQSIKLLAIAGIFIIFSGFKSQGQVTIFTENFENGGNMPTNWSQEYVVDTLNWVFTSGGFNSHPSLAHGGSFNALLFYAGSSKKTRLVSPAINLSYYSSIQLKFWHTQEEYSGDQDILKVYYKTSSSGTWTLLQTYSTSVASWTQRTISLPNPSSTYYIAFEGEAKYGYGICVDDLQISGNVTNGTDISCIGIDAPAIWSVGSNTLKITYKNLRSDTIKNADFGYKLNSGSVVSDTNKSTGNLTSNQTGVYTFSSNVTVTKGNHTIKVWARKPNRKSPDDDASNDTFSLSFGTGIKDTFVIDKKGTGNYTSFSAAVADLQNGVTGKVVFIVKPGTYTERVIIGDIPGTSSSKNVLFYSQYPDSVTITYNSTSQSTRATLVYKGADYVTFKNINISNSGATYGVCLLMRNNSNFNTFDNCKFNLSTSATNQYSQIILGSSDETSVGTAGANGNDNTFVNCKFTGGYYGVRWHGTNTAQPDKNISFKNCIFEKQYVYGLYLYYLQGFELSNSTIKEFRYNGAYGVLSYYSCGSKFDANYIFPGYIGLYLYLENYYNQTKTTTITNNMISGFTNSANQVGIYAYYYCYNLNILHNSIWLDGTANSYSYSAINLYYYATNCIIKNNLLASTNGSMILSLQYPNNLTVDYNDYYYSTSSSSKFSVNFTTMGFSSFKSFSSNINYPHDVYSYDNINPKFYSKYNLHLDTLTTPSLMAPSVGVAVDIDNNNRSTTLGVNLGADEIRHPKRDLDIISIDSPSVLKMGYNTVSVTLRNSGSDSIPVQKIYLSYNINSGSWVNDSLTLTQKLPPFGTIKFSFKTKWNVTSSTNQTLCARIYPLLINDPDTEDKICQTKCVGKSGTYYIDASGKGDYLTFNAALTSITNCGIAGPVKFIVRAGTYVERVAIDPIIGSSSANTVTFEGVHRDSVSIIYSGGYTDRATVSFAGADHVIFRNMKIQNNGNTYGEALHFKSSADSNIVENCILEVSSTISSYIICIVMSNSEESYYTYGNTGNYNLVKNCQIKNGYFGVSMVGSSKDILIYGNQFINNTMTNQYYMGFYLYYVGKTDIKGNSMTNFQYSFAYGIYSYYSAETKIEDNVIQPGYVGIFLYRENDVFRTKRTYIVNNMLSNFSNSAYHIGIYGYYYCYNLRIYHNSIQVTSSTASAAYSCIYLTTNCDSAIIKNNLLSITNNTYVIGIASCVGIECDYNDYYYPSSTAPFYNNAAYTTFSTFKASTGCLKTPHDQNSYDNKNPDFTSNTNLHLKSTSAGLGGVSGLGVPFDIDGDYRCQAYPSLGADEGGAKADFTINAATQCFDNHKFIFSNTSQGGSATLTYKWEFGDGTSSTTNSPQKTYSVTGTYNVKLIVYPSIGCNDTIVKTVVINPSANASFNTNNAAQCLNNNYFSFTNTSTISSGSLSYYWDFGDGYNAGVTNANHVYDNSGTFSVKLIATSNLGCKDTAVKTITVYPKPSVSFTINSAIQCSAGNNFSFTNQSTIASGTLSYLWNFGDGNTSTQTSPSHSYSSSNTFNVKLLATSNYGCKDSLTKTTQVDPTPKAGFTINDTSQCLNQNSFVFTNTTTVSSGSVNYTWYFGDGSTSTSTNPTKVYSSAGTYQVKLRAGNSQNCRDSITKTVIVHPSLIANFSINNSTQCLTGNSFSFTNGSTTTSGTTTYQWSFGDGDSAYTTNASHSYTDIGISSVELVASSTNGCADSITKTVTVKAMPVVDNDELIDSLLHDNLLVYYPFTGNAKDKSGNDNHATAYSTSLTTDKCNRNDSAYIFNGTSSYLQAPHAVLLTPVDEFSFAAWIYPTKANTLQFIAYKYNPTQHKGWQIRLYNNKVGALFGGQVNPFYSDSSVKINQWNHIVVTFDGDKYKFYINEKPAGSGTAAYNYLSTTPLYIGRQTSGNYFEGKIDEVYAFGKKLGNLEIHTLYNTLPYVKTEGVNLCSGNSTKVNIYNSQTGVDYSLWDTISKAIIGSKVSGNGCKISLSINNVTSAKVIKIKAEEVSTNCYQYFDTIINIFVAPNPVAAFSINNSNQCQTANSFVFTNNSTISSGTMGYLWKFGDASTSTQSSPTHTYSNSGTYSVELKATSNYGCTDTQTSVVTVFPVPLASFSVNAQNQCKNGNNFIFTNASTISSGSMSYLWRFGDGNTSTLQNPVHSYLNHGTYIVWLIVSSGNNCKDSISKTITVYPSPTAGFNVNPTESCLTGNNFNFTNTSTISSGSMTYSWNFGDNTTSTSSSPSHIYSTAGSFDIQLISTSNNGCKDTIIKSIKVHPQPKASFLVPDSSQCFDGNGFAFVNQSTISTGSMSYLWNFGDGSTSTQTNPVHSYTYADTFIVKLVVTSDKGCKDSITKQTLIHVNPMPDAAFSISDSTQCLRGNVFNFTDNSTISSGSYSRQWTFGNGNSSSATNPSQSYTNNNTYTVQLLITSNKGCKDSIRKNVYVYPHPLSAFSVNDSAQCLPSNSFVFTNNTTISSGTYSSLWSFGDASVSILKNPTHTYSTTGSYSVKLVTVSNEGCSDSVSKTVQVFAVPSPAFSINNIAQCLDGNSFVFTDQSTTPNGTTYHWTFGDGSISNLKNPTHIYTSAGTYQVKLKLSLGSLCGDSLTKTVTVYPEPLASFNVNDSTQCNSGNSFVFTNNSSISSGTLSYNWNFGDASTSNQISPSHTYSSSGNYSVNLIATSNNSCKDTFTRTLTVYPMPIAGFSINNDNQCLNGNSFTFTNSSTISSGTISYSWNFGDGNSSTNTNPVHTYSSAGTYQVKLMVTSGFDCKDSIVKTVYVRPMPVAAFTINDSDQCFVSNSFSFSNQSNISSGSLSYLWNFGDNTTSSLQNPFHAYSNHGTYSIKLVAISNYSCKDSIIKNIIVFPSPAVNFSINDSTQCLSGNSFALTNQTTLASGSMNYLWSFGDNNTSTSQNPTHNYLSAGTYMIKLIVITDKGCKDSISKTVYVYPQPQAAFSINDSDQCYNVNNFSFTNNSSVSTGSLSYLWNFGDNSTSSQTNPSHSYTNYGTYNVKLLVNTDKGCMDSVSKQLIVYPSPIAGFSINNDEQCLQGNSFSFTNSSTIGTGTISYSWTFGDGSSSVSQNPTHSYTSEGTYTVKLIVSSNNNCKDSISKTVVVHPMPKVDFSINDSTQCLSGNSFVFTNNSSVGTGTISSSWNFGDNTTSSQSNPTHTYSAAGYYAVKLIVSTNKSCKDSATHYVSVYSMPVANYSINKDVQCFNGNSFVFTNSSTISSGTLSYLWNTGDGGIATSVNLTKSYLNSGSFSVKLLATSDKGCKDSISKNIVVNPSAVPGFTINDTDQCLNGNSFVFSNNSSISSGSISYLWSFGDNSSSTLSNPQKTYSGAGTYSVKLKVISDKGCSDSITKSVYVYPSANTAFSINDTDQCLNGNSFILNNSSSISSGSISYLWSFGDGNYSTTKNDTHSYTLAGNYMIKLIVTSDKACSDSVSKMVYVFSSPQVAFSVNDSDQCLNGNSFVFSNNSSISSGSISYLWSFGDNSTSTLTNPQKTYSGAGTYTVKLKVVSDKGCSDSVTKSVYVYPSAYTAFSINDTDQCLKGNSFILNNSSSISSGSISYLWSFGDGKYSTAKNDTHSYTLAGNYTIKLKVTSDKACSDSVSKMVYVYSSPQTAFSVNDTDQCLNGNSFVFTNSSSISSGSISHLWSFGDNSSSTLTSPQKTYSGAGTYSVKLKVVSDKGCSDSVTKSVYVYPSVNTAFSINDTDQCLNGNSFILNNSSSISSGSISYLWSFGDGKYSTAKNDTHSYTLAGNYTIKLKVTSDKACSDSVSKMVYVYSSPQTAFSVNDTDQCLNGNSFVFTNSSSISSGSISHLWSFGDNSSSTLTSPQKTYSGAGTYSVKLKVVSDKGCSDSVTKSVYVYPSVNTAFSINDTDQCLNGNSFILNNSSSISSGSISYLWSFGDGKYSTAKNDTHSYTLAGNYTIKLKVTSDKACSDSVSKMVYVYSSPQTAFSVNDTDQCLNGNSFVFTNSSSISSGSISHLWSFGDNSSSTLTSPQKTYSGAGTYSVKLKVVSDKGCSDSVTKSVYVYPSPEADFVNNDSIQCFGAHAFKPQNNSTVSSGNISYLWKFGDGDTSTAKSPVHHFLTSGTYSVKLLVISNKNCTDSISKQFIVKPGPKAQFTVNDTALCFRNNQFIFNNSSQLNGYKPKYLWQFGDGDTSTKTNPTHSYKNPGTYTVILKVVPDSGCVDSIKKTIYVYPQPLAQFSINDFDQCLKTNTFLFTNTSTGTGLSNYWSFGDGGNSILNNPQHIYSKSGTFDVKLKVTNSNGCTDSIVKQVIVYPSPSAAFIINDSTQCQKGNSFSFTDQTSGTGNTRKWYFGDGGSSTGGPTVNKAYPTDGVYNVSLVITSDKGCKDSLVKKVYIYPEPGAAFTFINDKACKNENNVVFTNTSTIKSGTLSYNWSFGDGNNSNLKDPQHHFSTAQTFNVKLVAISDKDCRDSVIQNVVIHPTPLANFSINNNPQCFRHNHFIFLNSSSIPSGTMTYLWDFGDIYKSTDQNSSHIYTAAGTYSVKLIVTSDKGCKDSVNKQTTVYPTPKASFSVNQNPQCLFGNSFKFTNNSTISNGTLSTFWAFGDGANSTASDTVKHSYSTIDTFKVMLVSSSDKSCPDTVYKDVRVKPSPKFSLGKDVTTKPGLIYNIDAGPDWISYKWFNGKTTRINSLNTSDLGIGDHYVWVIVTDSSGCQASDTILLRVWPSSINELGNNAKYRIYPNPARENVKLDMEGLNSQLVNIIVTDVNGKILENRQIQPNHGTVNTEFDLRDYSKGIYYVKINIGDYYFMEKIVVY